jgi:hypothetical protein
MILKANIQDGNLFFESTRFYLYQLEENFFETGNLTQKKKHLHASQPCLMIKI